MQTTARFDLKIDAQEKDVIAKAAALMGTTMAAFVRVAAKEKAQELLARERSAAVSKETKNFSRASDTLSPTFSTHLTCGFLLG